MDQELVSRRPPPDPGTQSAQDWDDGVLETLYALVFGEPDVAQAGVLVGHDDGGPGLPAVLAVIPAGKVAPPAHAVLGHTEWAYVHEAMARHYAGLQLVGWWASRPMQGTGLNEIEVKVMGEYFAAERRVGMVFDSRRYQGALYGWRGGQIARLHEGPIPRKRTRRLRHGRTATGATIAVTAGLLTGLVAWLLIHYSI